MFIGHFAPALVAASHKKSPGLGTLFVAGQLVDFGFFALVLAGIEKMRITPGMSAMNPMDLYHMPYTHSLLGSLIWAVVFGAIIAILCRNKTSGLLAGLVVLSHWFVDLLVHIPDLSLLGEKPSLGFGLWNHPMIAMPLELMLISGSLLFYMSKTERKHGKSNLPLWVLIGVMAIVQAFDWFGPRPTEFSPDMAWTALVAYSVMAGIAAWFGSTRRHKA